MRSAPVTMQDAAKLIGIGPNTLFQKLRTAGVLTAQGGLKNTPRHRYVKAGYFRLKQTEYHTGPVRHTHIKTLVTPEGLVFINDIITGANDDLATNGPALHPERTQVPRQ